MALDNEEKNELIADLIAYASSAQEASTVYMDVDNSFTTKAFYRLGFKWPMQRNSFLINKKIHQYILPGILMTVAMQLGIVVDGMIVGKIMGPDAMAAIEISRPVLLILQLPAMMLAMGGAAQAAVFLGKRDLPQADGIFSASLAAGAGLVAVNAMAATSHSDDCDYFLLFYERG